MSDTPSQPHSDPGRKRLPHHPPVERANQSIIIYVTQNVQGRRHLLATSEAHENLRSAWRQADHWLVGRYVIMPDHVHIFCAPVRVPRTPLKTWMEFWKSRVSAHWPRGDDKPIWQRDFFDRQLRLGESYTEKWRYIVQNPVKAELVSKPEDWPFQGEIDALVWHDEA